MTNSPPIPADDSRGALPASIGVTGVSGYLGQRLVSALAERDYAGKVVGLDLRPPVLHPEFLDFRPVDATTAAATEALRGCDAVVHLAYVFNPTPDTARDTAVNLGAFERALAAVRAPNGPRKLVVASSATAYGAYENNPVPLTEDAPLRPNEGFVYAVCKGEIERRIVEFRREHPDTVVTVFRPAVVLGPTVTNYLADLIVKAPPVGLRDEPSALQFVHEDDVAAALLFALAHDLDGVYNVAADGWMTPDEVRVVTGGRRSLVRLPPDAARRFADRMFAAGRAPLPASVLPYMRFPWVVDNTRLAHAGFRPRHSNEAALGAATTARAAAARNRPSPAVLVAAGAAAALGAVLLRRRLRRR